MLGYLSLNIICSPKLTDFLGLSLALGKLLDCSQPFTLSCVHSIVDRETMNSLEKFSLLGTDVQRRISSENIFAPNDHDVL